jgi:hypothetical protein
MAAIHLDTVFCAMQAVPCVIALAKGKDPTTKTVCGILVAIDVVLGLGPYIGLILKDLIYQITCATLGGLGIFAAVRVAQPTLSTLIVSGGLLLAAIAFRLVG